MLVLSRRLNEQILFPDFDTAVKVLAVKGNTVRLGIEAPLDVTILREEVPDLEEKNQARLKHVGKSAERAAVDAEREKNRQLNHLLRNRLNVAGLGLALLSRQLQAGLLDDGQATLAKIHEDFDLLRDRMDVEMEQPAATPLPRARALIVEDDRNERELLAGLLRLSGMDVDLAENGVDALDYLRDRGNPDIVLLDMILPRCDGPTTVREIRKNPANNRLKIFGLTGHAPDSFHLEGVNRWFRKPLNAEVLLHDLNLELEGAASGL